MALPLSRVLLATLSLAAHTYALTPQAEEHNGIPGSGSNMPAAAESGWSGQGGEWSAPQGMSASQWSSAWAKPTFASASAYESYGSHAWAAGPISSSIGSSPATSAVAAPATTSSSMSALSSSISAASESSTIIASSLAAVSTSESTSSATKVSSEALAFDSSSASASYAPSSSAAPKSSGADMTSVTSSMSYVEETSSWTMAPSTTASSSTLDVAQLAVSNATALSSSETPAPSAASNATATLPQGGILSIPVGGSTPIASLLATAADCVDLMDGKLPSQSGIPSASGFQFSGNVRSYYVAAEQVAWNYAPSGWDNWLGVPVSQSPHAAGAGFLNVTGSIGADGGLTWQKAIYKGYTDSSFTTPTEQPATNGINGPIIRAEVGDMIQIHFINKLSQNYASMHSMGLAYSKSYEGALYPNTTTGQSPSVQEQDAVPPGGCAVYKWLVGDAQAPGDGQNSRLWSYHSFINMPADVNAGLSGPLIVYSSGQMSNVMSSNREFVVTLNSHYEAKSFLAGVNAKQAGLDTASLTQTNALVGGRPHAGNESFWVPQLTNFPGVVLSDAQAPPFFSINGYVLGNGAPYEMCTGDSVKWYVMSYGQASHVFHLHGNNYKYLGAWQAATSVDVGEMFTFEMTAQLPGVWQLMCHVASHNFFGMQQNYVVYATQEGQTCPLPALTTSST